MEKNVDYGLHIFWCNSVESGDPAAECNCRLANGQELVPGHDDLLERLDRAEQENKRLRESLKLINGQCEDFEHGDDNLKAFVRGLGKHARSALKTGEQAL